MSDEMMRARAKNGGVIMINYQVSLLSEENRVAGEKSGAVVGGARQDVQRGDEA